MKGFSLSKRRAAIGVLFAVGLAALIVTVLPAIGGPIGGNIPPISNAGVMPTEADTGGQSNDCALFGFPASAYSSYRIDTPKSQSYNAGGGVSFTLSVAATGSNKDKYFDYTVSGAAVYAVGVKGGSNTAKYVYPSSSPANVAKWPAFSKPGDKTLYSDAKLHAPAQAVDGSGNPTQLYSVSNVTFCFKKSATVSGVVFNDANSDGFSTGESGIGDAMVTLYDGTTPVGAPFKTLTDGAYAFSGLSIGKTYTICQASLGTNWTRTVPVATTSGTVTCPDGILPGYSVTAVGAVSGLNFGNVQTASIQGRVFVDAAAAGGADANGAPDTGEGVSTQAVTVRKGTFSGSATFGADGAFTISGVPVGTGYTLCVAGGASLRQIVPVAPAGTACSVEGTRGFSIDLGSSGSTGNSFGFVRQATISGTLFNDANANGMQDLPGEGSVDPARKVYLLKGTTQVGSPINTGGSFNFGAQDVGTTYTVCVASVAGEVQTYPKSSTAGSGVCSSVNGANPVGWRFQLTSDGNTTLGFGSVVATVGSCLEPFGNLPFYRIMLKGVNPCDKSFVVSYSDTDSNKSAELRPVAATDTLYPMVEYIQWTLPSDGTQLELRYDDTLDNIAPKEMLHCKIDPRQDTSLIAAPSDPADGSDLELATPLAADSAVFPAAPEGYDNRNGLVTSCLILDIEKDGKYVAYVYSSIDGFRDGT